MAKASEVNNGSQNGIGEPYYCLECKRNHTKGKIYKEHLNFARVESEKEDAVEVESDSNELEIEDNNIIEEESEILEETDEDKSQIDIKKDNDHDD